MLCQPRRSNRQQALRQVCLFEAMRACPKITSRRTVIHNNRWRIQGRARSKREGKGRARQWVTRKQAQGVERASWCALADFAGEGKRGNRWLIVPSYRSHLHSFSLTHTYCIYANIRRPTRIHTLVSLTGNVTVWHPWQFGVTMFWDPIIHKNNSINKFTINLVYNLLLSPSCFSWVARWEALRKFKKKKSPGNFRSAFSLHVIALNYTSWS